MVRHAALRKGSDRAGPAGWRWGRIEFGVWDRRSALDAPRFFSDPPPEARELDLPTFLEWLGAPAVFHLRGASPERVRVVCGGLHGNEPSGFRAVHAILRDPPALACDAVLILGNVPAALHPPRFSHRFVPGSEDMNRVWADPRGTPQREAAGRILGHLHDLVAEGRTLEAVVDVHNNTGYNPIYGVVIDRDPRRILLGRAWTHRFVNYEGIHLGTFLEEVDAPGVVIECGQAGDPEADRRGLAGALAFLTAADPFALDRRPEPHDHLYRSVARVTIPEEVSVAFADAPGDADLTISPRIDRANFEVLPAGTRLAHRTAHGRLEVTDNDDRPCPGYLRHTEDAIVTEVPIVPVMMTTNAVVAKSDCLLYVAERLPSSA